MVHWAGETNSPAFWRAMTGPRRSDTKTFRLEPKTQLQDRTCVPSEEQAFNRRLRDLVGIERREHLPVLDDRAHVGNILLNETDDAVAEGLAQLVPGVFPQRVRRVLQKNTRDGEPRRRREAACVCFIITAMASHPPTPESNRSSERSDRHSPYLGVHAINIFVRDQDQSLRFYVDQLGFDLAFDVRLQSGDRWVAVAPPDGSALLALIVPKLESRAYQRIGQSTGVVFVTEDVIAKYGEWRKRGVRFQYAPRLRRVKYGSRPTASYSDPSSGLEEQDSIWGGVFTHFKDLDGNTFALVGFDEVSREIEAHRRAMAEKLEAERRAAQELEIATQVQARLFPQTLPSIRTLEYAGSCFQARQVGGDYYDFLDLGGDRFGLIIGDIAGKGIAAALLMANLQANLRIQCGMAFDHLQRLLRSVNHIFHENSTESAYATLFFSEYEDEGRRLRYANCGHLPALLLRSDNTLERLESTGTVLGLFRDWDCLVGERRLFAGDTLAVYTDGLTESFNDAGEEFGEERLVAALRRHRHLPSQDIIAAVVDEVRRFSAQEQHDDITLTVARCR